MRSHFQRTRPPGTSNHSGPARVRKVVSRDTFAESAEPARTLLRRPFVLGLQYRPARGFLAENSDSSLRASLNPYEGCPRIFVIDEAQKTFRLGRGHAFWEALRGINLVQQQADSRVQVLLLGVYCSLIAPGESIVSNFSTPVDIHDGWSLAFLCLDSSEVSELFCAYNATCRAYLRPQIPLSVQCTISHICGQHVGLLRSSIVRFADVFRDHISCLTATEEAAFIRNELLKLGEGGDMRSLPQLDRLSPDDAGWLIQVALRGPAGLRRGVSSNNSLARLVLAGVFDYDVHTRLLRFSSHLMQCHALQQLFGTLPRTPISVTEAMTAIDVAREVVKRFDSRTLSTSLSSSADGT